MPVTASDLALADVIQTTVNRLTKVLEEGTIAALANIGVHVSDLDDVFPMSGQLMHKSIDKIPTGDVSPLDPHYNFLNNMITFLHEMADCVIHNIDELPVLWENNIDLIRQIEEYTSNTTATDDQIPQWQLEANEIFALMHQVNAIMAIHYTRVAKVHTLYDSMPQSLRNLRSA